MSVSKTAVFGSAEKTMTFQRNTTTQTVLQYADECRNAGRFTDVTIKLENQCLPANKIILACFSRYFESMFVTEMSEKYQNAVELKGFDNMAVKLIIDYFYSGCIVINSDNVLKILAAADYIQVDDVKGFCFEFLESSLTIETCLDVISAYNFYKPEASLNLAYEFLSKHLDEISLEENLKALSRDDFCSVIKKLDLDIVKESSKYTAITNWVKHDVEARKVDLQSLIQLIDLSQVDFEFLEDVIATESLIQENIACLNAVFKCYISRCKEMQPKSSGSKILCIGGNKRGSVVEVPNIFLKSVSTYPDLPLNVSQHGALYINQSVFCIGGLGAELRTERVFQLNLRNPELKWKEVASLKLARSQFGASVFNGCLIVAGGLQNSTRTASVDMYELQKNKWRQISPLNSIRSKLALVSCRNRLFAIGGFNDNHLSSVECLNDLNGKWEYVTPMQSPRCSLAAVYCDGFIYAIGGISQTGAGKSVEKYNLDEHRWSKVASMNIKRYGHSACVLHGKIVVVGGRNAACKPVSEIECYNPVNDTWSIVGNSEHDFIFHSLVVV